MQQLSLLMVSTKYYLLLELESNDSEQPNIFTADPEKVLVTQAGTTNRVPEIALSYRLSDPS